MPEGSEHQSAPENWYLSNTTDRPFVATSIATTGQSREVAEAQRTTAAGNMSELYAQPNDPNLDAAENSTEAKQRVNKFLDVLDLEPTQTAIMRPQRDYTQPLHRIDIDNDFHPGQSGSEATWLEERADFIFTRDPEKVLACRPADCPVLVGQGIDDEGRKILFLEHLAWGALNAGYLEQGLAFLSTQGATAESLRLYIAPGARPQSYHYRTPTDPLGDEDSRFTHPERDKLFVNVRGDTSDQGQAEYHFDIDTIGFIRSQLKAAGVKDWQVFEDTSDTAAPESGHSSHTRSKNADEIETRDIVVATMKPGAGSVSY